MMVKKILAVLENNRDDLVDSEAVLDDKNIPKCLVMTSLFAHMFDLLLVAIAFIQGQQLFFAQCLKFI